MSVGLFASLTDEQSLLVQASVRFMEVEHAIAAVRKCADGDRYDEQAYRATAAQLGWLGFLADGALGGGSVSGNGLVDAATVAAERGARLQPAPFVGHSVVVDALSTTAHFRGPATLEGLIDGAAWATWAFEADPGCSIRREDGALRLDGHIGVTADADACEQVLITARGPDGLTQALVPTDHRGISLRQLAGLDVTRRWFDVTLDDVAVDEVYLVEEPGPKTEALVERETQIAAVLTAAETVGAMHADLESATAYSLDRIAFGRPIGSFQAVKHLLANCSLWLEMSKGIVGAAATAVGQGDPDGPQLAHAAKSFVAERSLEVAHGCFQVYGGIGFTWEHDQHLYFRRIAADAACFGSAASHRRELLPAAGLASS
jgi:alkylation response protein AidB-like acyl-CoA dehydrogenase